MNGALEVLSGLCESKNMLKPDISILKILQKEEVITAIDVHLARFLSSLTHTSDDDILLGIALASNAINSGNVCLDLSTVAGRNLIEKKEENRPEIICPELDIWQQKLRSSALVGTPGLFRPLILDEKNRLYLYRYWEYEHILAQSIRERMNESIDSPTPALLEKLNKLFAQENDSHIHQQKLAVLMPALRRFSVISGGPGTGKTTLVAKILAFLIDLHSPKGMNIFLVAPTGKAAAGLRESIQKAKETLNCSETTKALIPDEAYTVHRMLGSISRSPYFRYNKTNRLPADILVVDEASMMDLPLMSKLMQAISSHTRVILMGDKDQLASVESGTVLGDICNQDHHLGYSFDFFSKMKALGGKELLDHIPVQEKPSGLRDHIVILEKSHRFSSDQGIGGLSRAINQGKTDMAMSLLKDPVDSQVGWIETSSQYDFFQQLSKQILSEYTAYLRTDDPSKALMLFNQFQLICAVRKGPFGIETINRLVEQVLHREGLIQSESKWYKGRPILITRNHYGIQLFNGDMGILMIEPASDQDEISAFFPDRSGVLRCISPHRLPEHETAFAITVHKSQGSEFEQVHLILPDRDSPLLTRELLYTGITRAKKQVWIWANESVLRTAISRKIERSSGLRDALWET